MWKAWVIRYKLWINTYQSYLDRNTNKGALFFIPLHYERAKIEYIDNKFFVVVSNYSSFWLNIYILYSRDRIKKNIIIMSIQKAWKFIRR